MIRNYFKTALRSLGKRPGFTTINTVGLAVALACCLLVGLFVQSEWSYDTFHERSDRLYRAWVEEHYEDKDLQNVITPLPLAPTLERSFPEVEETVRLFTPTDVVRRGDTQFRERMHVVDPEFFEVFDFSLRKGTPATVFDDPGSVVLTPSLAEKYFGDETPMGKSLDVRVGGEVRPLIVSGIAASPPSNSSIQYDLLLPLRDAYFGEGALTNWFTVHAETYVLLRKGTSPGALQEKMPSMIRQAIGEEEYARSEYGVNLQPITDIHLNTRLPSGLEPISSPLYSYVLAAMALIVLLIACINFMTLSVGRSAERAKEVGMRKALGANRNQLMAQFWGETFLLVGGALALGFVLARVFLPVFNTLAARELAFALDGGFLAIVGGLLLVVGIVAGSYPALVLSGLPSAQVLRGTFQIGGHRPLRRGLVGLQFALSMVLVTGVLAMQQQLDYLQSKNLGFDAEHIVTVPTTGRFDDGVRTYQLLRDELRNEPTISSVTAASYTPDVPWMDIERQPETGSSYEFKANVVTHDYIETMGIQLVAGRSFSREIASDTSRGIIVNRALVEQQGWTMPIGKQLPGMVQDHEVIGVTENFHYASLHERVEPLVLAPNLDLLLRGAANVGIPGSPTPTVTLRLQAGDIRAAINAVEHAWTTVAPSQPFSYTFLEDAVGRQYREEQRMMAIVGVAAGLALFIACFGLLGLASLVVQQRTKEIGVRKALGATAVQIVGRLSKEFVRLVAIACLIAVPVAYWAAGEWLQDFAYRIDLGPDVFGAAGGLVLAIAFVTVSTQAFRAARTDPATTLRDE